MQLKESGQRLWRLEESNLSSSAKKKTRIDKQENEKKPYMNCLSEQEKKNQP